MILPRSKRKPHVHCNGCRRMVPAYGQANTNAIKCEQRGSCRSRAVLTKQPFGEGHMGDTSIYPSSRGRKFPSNWREIRQQIFNRDGGRCQQCDTDIAEQIATYQKLVAWNKDTAARYVREIGIRGFIGHFFQVDHIVRAADGGSDAEDNLRTLCVPCHHDITLTQNWLDRQSKKPASKELTEREQFVLDCRLGRGRRFHTLEELAGILNVTRERVRQIELRAMRRMENTDGSVA